MRGRSLSGSNSTTKAIGTSNPPAASSSSPTSVGNDLVLDSLPALTDIDSYTNLHTIGGDLELRDNHTLQNIGALMNLWILSGDFRVIDNFMLPTSQVENLIEHLLLNQYNGNIIVSGNLDD